MHVLNVVRLCLWSDYYLSLLNCAVGCGGVSEIFINTVFMPYAAVDRLLALLWDGPLLFFV